MTRAQRRKRTRLKFNRYRDKIKVVHANVSDEFLDDFANGLTNHGKLCSCHMCGNPRKHWKELSLQERRQKELADYQERRLQEK